MRIKRSVIVYLFVAATFAHAEVPQLINYQGRIAVGGTNFTGTGQFQFALVNNGASQTYWSNGVGTVAAPVTKGLYSVLLGDVGMNSIPSSVFTNSDVRLRVWFNDGVSGLMLLSPDQRIVAVGYALMAGNVPDGSITSSKLADNAVTSAKLAAGAVGSSQLASNLANAIVPWQVSGGLTPSASANTGYILTNATLTELVLPSTANVGDVVRVSGVGAGGWQIAPNVGQTIAGYSAALTPGETWMPCANNSDAWYGLAVDYDGSTIVGVGSYGGRVWISHDSGTNWITWGSTGFWSLAVSSADGMKLAVINNNAGNGQIYTSADGGTNWVAQGSVRNWDSIASSADGTHLAATVWSGQIYTSTDSGSNWIAREQNRNWSGVASSADGMKLAATVSGGQIYTSTDGGVNWTAHGATNNWSQIASSVDGTKLLAGTSPGFLYTSSDSGQTWVARGTSNSWAYVASSGDGNVLMANAHGSSGRIYLSTDGGVTWNQKENIRYWRQVAVSGDGRVVAAEVDRGYIYISHAELTGETVAGAQGTTAALQYMGNGVWQPLNESLLGNGVVGSSQLRAGAVGNLQLASNAVQTVNIAAGAVGSSQLAGGAVTTSAIATGAITSALIATGAVDAVQLAKPPRSGSIPSSSLSVTFNYAATNIAFSVPFNTTPIVTLGLETGDSAIAEASSLVVLGRTATNFTVRWRNSSLPVTLDSSGDVGWEPSLAYIGPNPSLLRPSISYRDRDKGDLKFIRAQNMDGTVWLSPVSVTTNGNVGAYSSLLWLQINVPAIGYYDADNQDLKYVRANNADGTSWGAPVTVDSLNDVGAFNSMIRLGNGYPAIAYYDGNYGDLKFAGANDTSGTSWAAPVYVESNEIVSVDCVFGAAVVSGNPAILYHNPNGTILYTRANDATGSTWPTGQIVATGTVANLSIVNGRPAFCYNQGGTLYYQRAADSTGGTWNAAIALDTATVSTTRSLQLAVVVGKPAVSYYDFANGDLKHVAAADADGTTWNTPVTVDSAGTVGYHNSLAEVNSSPAIVYYDTTNGDLKFVRHRSPGAFTIHWIALEP